MLGAVGYRYKKDLKGSIGLKLQYEETSAFGPEFDPDGVNTVVSPEAATKRDWFAEVTCLGGIIQKVT